tara:strand:+ start:1037 stop:2131 length:1095 start_codon:yes stop_codon:yes gene_type:complete
MQKINITVPRLNPNDDELLVVDIFVSKGQKISKGQKLCVFETTKAAVDFESEVDGVVEEIFVKKEKYSKVGEKAISILSEKSDPEKFKNSLQENQNIKKEKEKKISLKAQKILDDNKLKIEDLKLPNKKIIAEDVINYLNSSKKIKVNSKNIIIGTGMHSKLVADILSDEKIDIEGFISQNQDEIGTNVTRDLKVITCDKFFEKDLKVENFNFYVGVGGSDNNLSRIKVFNFYEKYKSNMPCLISSKAYVSKNSKIGEGSIVLPGANIGPNVVIGKNCIINNNAVVCHDTIVGDHVHITPGATIAGNCKIGNYSTIGMCSTVYFSVEIGENCLIYNNTAVLQNLRDGNSIDQFGKIFRNKYKLS